MPPGRQRTFDLIPTTLVTTTESKPPMTSKAAKKAYAKSKQGPKVSRAEQRRLDALEIERQKKEFEREKAARKAKAVRERKAEKEEKARLERKKAGLPEPSRYVRASQPTISRFVQGENGKRKWCDVEEESDGSGTSEGEGARDQRDAKRVAVVDALREGEETYVEANMGQKPQQQAMVLSQKQDNPGQPLNIPDDKEIDSEDEFGDFPTLSQLVCLDGIEKALIVNSNKLEETEKSNTADKQSTPVLEAGEVVENLSQPKSAEVQMQPTIVETPKPVEEQSSLKTPTDMKPRFDNSKNLSDLVNAQIMSQSTCESTEPDEPEAELPKAELPKAELPKAELPKPELPKPSERKLVSAMAASIKPTPPIIKKTKPPPAAGNADCYGYANMLKPKKSTASMLPPPLPKDRSTNSTTSKPPTNMPMKERVSANNVQIKPLTETSSSAKPKKSVSFVPTPSLQPPPIAYSASYTTSSDPPPSTQAFLEDNFEDFFPTSSQEMRELLDDIDFDDIPSNTQIARELSVIK